MTNAEMRAIIRATTEFDDSDGVLDAFLSLAEREILNRLYPYNNVENPTMPERFETMQIKIATYMLGKRGAEGEIQHIENGVHRNYRSPDIPDEMFRGIVPLIGVVGE